MFNLILKFVFTVFNNVIQHTIRTSRKYAQPISGKKESEGVCEDNSYKQIF